MSSSASQQISLTLYHAFVFFLVIGGRQDGDVTAAAVLSDHCAGLGGSPQPWHGSVLARAEHVTPVTLTHTLLSHARPDRYWSRGTPSRSAWCSSAAWRTLAQIVSNFLQLGRTGFGASWLGPGELCRFSDYATRWLTEEYGIPQRSDRLWADGYRELFVSR